MVLIGGFDKNNSPALYSSEPSGFSSQWKAIAIGKNGEKVNEFLEKKYVENMEYKEAIKVVLESMLEYVEAGSKNIEVAVMNKENNMKFISDEEIDNLSNVIELEKKSKESK